MLSTMRRVTHYTSTAIRLHWWMAIGIIGAFLIGLYMTDLSLSPTKLQLYAWHKWIGVTLFILALLRLVWRLAYRPPAPPAGMPAWQHLAATTVHYFLYVLIFAIPLSGWLMSSAKGYQTVLFALLPLPDLLHQDQALGEVLETVHKTLNLSLAGLVLAHVAAALKHHFVDHTNVLQRMLPFLNTR